MKMTLLRFCETLACLFLVLVTALSAQQPAVEFSAPAQDHGLVRLRTEIKRLAKNAGGRVGVSALHLESNRRISLNGNEAFPMASTYKIPIAVQLMHRVDVGEIKLDDMVSFRPSDLHPGSGTLSDLLNQPGLALSVRNLMELMLLISDNSATDVVLRLAGGSDAVTQKMKALGIDGIRVDRPTALLIANWVGINQLPPSSEWSPKLFGKLFSGVSPEQRRAAAERFDQDPRDTAGPDAMVTLLQRIYKKDLLQKDSAELLLDIMYRCRTGEGRLKGVLPQETEVAHKTGTIGGSTNDVGIMNLPNGAGHVAIAVFIKSSDRRSDVRERAIADISRAVHDFFLFNPN